MRQNVIRKIICGALSFSMIIGNMSAPIYAEDIPSYDAGVILDEIPADGNGQIYDSIPDDVIIPDNTQVVNPAPSYTQDSIDGAIGAGMEEKALSVYGGVAVNPNTYGMDFSSRRLVLAIDATGIVDPANILSEYNGVYLMQYASEEEARLAYSYYENVAVFVDPDIEMAVAEDGYVNEELPAAPDGMTEEANPLSELEKEMSGLGLVPGKTVAVIDTGMPDGPNVKERVSMLGDFVDDDNGHGSKMASLIIEQDPNARIISIKAMDAAGKGNISSVYAAMQYAIAARADIILLSISALSTADNAALTDAVKEAVANGSVVVGAAGNNGRDAAYFTPANIGEAIIVGAADESGAALSTSNFGATVDYNVVADSTSQAAAKMAGFLSKNGAVSGVDENGLIFSTSYIPAEFDENTFYLIDDEGNFVTSDLVNLPSSYSVVRFEEGSYQWGVHYETRSGNYRFLYCVEQKTTSSSSNNYGAVNNAKYTMSSELKTALSYAIGNGLQRMNSRAVNRTYRPVRDTVDKISGQDFHRRDYHITQVAIWRIIYAYTGNTTYGSNGNLEIPKSRGGDFLLEWNQAEQLKNDAIAYAKAHASDERYYSNELKMPVAGTNLDLHLTADEQYYETDEFVVTNVYNRGANEGVTVTAEGPVTPEVVETNKRIITQTANPATPSDTNVEYLDKVIEKTFKLRIPVSDVKSLGNGPHTWTIKATGEGRGYGVHLYRNGNSQTTALAISDETVPLELKATASVEIEIIYPNIKTSAKDKATNTNVGDVAKSATIVDTVTYEDVTPGETYTLQGTLMDRSTGKELLVNGKKVTASKKFTPSAKDGKVNVNFTLDASGLAGKEIVVFEKLLLNGEEKAKHEEITDKAQTIIYPSPSITTNAKDAATGSNKGAVSKTDKIVDTISYKDLTPNKAYVLKATLMDKETGAAVKIGGKEVTAEKSFTPTAAEGTEEVVFNLDSSDLKGKTVVSFEYLFRDNVQIAKHDDINDEAQSVTYPNPQIETEAKDGTTNSHTGDIAASATIVDVVTYKNLVKGQTYTLTGTLMDQTTGEPIQENEQDITVTKEFKAEAETGTVEMTFTLNATAMKGKSAVVFEKLYLDGVEIASHTDINDDAQTVNYPGPSVATSAKDGTTGTQTGTIAKAAKVIDTVTYKGLTPGREYEIRGQLMDKSTKKILQIDGKNVTTTKTFMPETADGTVTMEFDLDSSKLYGKTVVAYEYVYTEGTRIAAHANINDKKQSITYPSPIISTRAKDGITGTATGSLVEEATLIDTITYKGLGVGITYVMSGTLMDKATGQPVQKDGKDIVVTKEFVPEKTNGTVEMEFTFNPTTLSKDSVVVFETLLQDSEILVSHEDINDKAQTVTYPKPELTTDAKDSDTQDHVGSVKKEATIIDVVHYKGLTPGQEYRLKATLMDKKTGEPVQQNGQDVVVEKTFTPEKAEGDEEVVITVNSSLLAGTTVVAFERLYHQDTELAVHTDINDDNQAVTYPTVATSAVDGQTQTHDGTIGKTVTVVDTVSMTGLITGQAYHIDGRLMNKATKKNVKQGGKNITASADFVAEGPEMSVQLTFTVDSTALMGSTVVAYEKLLHQDLEVAKHENINDAAQAVTYEKPEVTTDAKDLDTQDHVGTVKAEATIVDVVTYKELTPGKEYTLKATLMNRETKAPVQQDGKDVTAEKTFTPNVAEGTEEITFVIDSTLLQGATVVAFEKLYKEGIEVAVHTDINDDNQAVTYPTVRTVATDGFTNTHTGTVGKTETISDRVDMTGLVVGQTYRIDGTLMDKATGEAIQQNGKPVTATIEFTANTKTMTAELVFEVDSMALVGKTVVVFEKLNHKDVEVARHEDINDADQSVTYPTPEVTTDAKDLDTQDHVGTVKKEATIVDVVTYKGLTPGKEYTLKATLMNRETNAPVQQDGKDVTAEKTFTPEAAEGTEELTFVIDSTLLQGATVVAFERLYKEDIEVAVHTDINDDNQAVTYPTVRTVATDGFTNTHTGTIGKTETIKDRVDMTGLVIGQTYRVDGTLMDKISNNPIEQNGKAVTATYEFTADAKEMTVELVFEVDSMALVGKTVVVFEKLNHKDVEVARHEDINDADQSVTYPTPEVTTDAKDLDTQDHVGTVKKEATIVDVVTYKGLTPGKEYTLKATLMNRETNAPVQQDGKDVTAEKTFTPEAAEGTEELTFVIDSTLLQGATVVAFERLYKEDIEVAVHTDINDDNQAVTYPTVSTTATSGEFADEEVVKHIGALEENAVVSDRVDMTGLIVGQSYTVTGVLMDKTSGEPVKVNGKDLTAEKTFTAEKSDMSVVISFTLDTRQLEGKTVVAFETLLHNNVPVAEHKDINDYEQSIFYPEVPHKEVDKMDNNYHEATHTWTVTQKIPEGYAGLDKSLKTFAIEDVLDARLDWDSFVSLEIADVNGEQLVKDTDYTVTEPAEAGGTLAVAIDTESGIGKLSANEGKTIVLKFKTTINESAAASDKLVQVDKGYAENANEALIPNQAVVTIGGVSNWTEIPYVYTADIEVYKTGSDNKPLAGAEFVLMHADRSAFIRGGVQYKVVTGNDGKAIFAGLENGTYFIRETKAPAGKELLAEDICVVIENGVVSKVNDKAVSENARTIHITDENKIILMTGGEGKAPFAAAAAGTFAAAGMLAALALYLKKRRYLG